MTHHRQTSSENVLVMRTLRQIMETLIGWYTNFRFYVRESSPDLNSSSRRSAKCRKVLNIIHLVRYNVYFNLMHFLESQNLKVKIVCTFGRRYVKWVIRSDHF